MLVTALHHTVVTPASPAHYSCCVPSSSSAASPAHYSCCVPPSSVLCAIIILSITECLSPGAQSCPQHSTGQQLSHCSECMTLLAYASDTVLEASFAGSLPEVQGGQQGVHGSSTAARDPLEISQQPQLPERMQSSSIPKAASASPTKHQVLGQQQQTRAQHSNRHMRAGADATIYPWYQRGGETAPPWYMNTNGAVTVTIRARECLA